jgi:hypothetical protein
MGFFEKMGSISVINDFVTSGQRSKLTKNWIGGDVL